MRRLATLASIIVVLFAFVGGGSTGTAGADEDCPDILVLGMRGSGEPFAGDDGLGRTVVRFWQEFRPRVPADESVELWANPYPGVAVVGGFTALITGIDAVANQARLGRYHQSITLGQILLRNELDDRTARCANTRFVLAGYSQGAHVAADTYAGLPPEIADRVVGMALIGDPTFNSDSRSSEGSYEVGRDGLIAKRTEFRTPGQVMSYCHRQDPVCQGLFDFNRTGLPRPSIDFHAHTNYMDVGDGPGQPTYPLQAARWMANRISPAPVSSGPTAVITPVDGAVAGEQFRISAAQSYDAQDRPLTYDWDLDNSGAYATRGDGSSVLCVLQRAGTHIVGLRVTNDAGQVQTTTAAITVTAPDEFSKPPRAPVDVVATPSADQRSATLTWRANPDGPPTEFYELWTTDGDSFGVVASGGAGSRTFPLEDLPISIAVQANNRAGDGEKSAPVAITVAGPGKPADDLNELWNDYGDKGGHWTGGDRTTSVPLPDGRRSCRSGGTSTRST